MQVAVPLKILVALGTRPEAIKLASVIQELSRHSDAIRTTVCATFQHRQMLDQVLNLFEIVPDIDLDVMQAGQSLAELTSRILTRLDPVLADLRPDWVVVQGDTTTAMAASLAAFYRGVKVAHVEAGLRTYDRQHPFPEEINRRITSLVADLHFAPTERARQALLAEGVDAGSVVVTGNTVIDALLWVRDRVTREAPQLPVNLIEAIDGRKVILVTGHRRESFGKGFEQICLALRDIVEQHSDICIVFPVHLNPAVRQPVQRILGQVPGIRLLEPLAYDQFVWIMNRAYLILTDSGGVQEEAPSLGKPVLLMRETTERPEGVEAGVVRVVGTSRSSIVAEVNRLIGDESVYKAMSSPRNPYGDGLSGQRIVSRLIGGD